MVPVFIRRYSCSATFIILKITDRSFRYASPCLWNQLPLSLRQHHSGTSSSISDSSIPSPITSSSSDSPLCSSITPSLFHSGLKTYLFYKSYPRSLTSSSRIAFTKYHSDRFLWATRFWILVFAYFSFLVPCARFSWPSCQVLSARKYIVSYRIVSYRMASVISPQWFPVRPSNDFNSFSLKGKTCGAA